MNNTYKYVLLIMVLLFCTTLGLTAQPTEPEKERPYRIGASLGYSFSGYREETFSPMNRYLNALTYTIDGSIEKGYFLHSLNLSFFMGNAEKKGGDIAELVQDYDPHTGEAHYLAKITHFLDVRAYIEYALDYRLWGNDVFPGFLGGAFRTDAYLQFAQYPSITGLFSLDLHASQQWNIDDKNRLTLSVSFPFFGYAVRPAYAGGDHFLIKYSDEDPLKILTLGRILSLHNYWAVFGDLKYHHKITSLISFSSGIYYELSRINEPRPRIDAIFRLNTGISFTF